MSNDKIIPIPAKVVPFVVTPDSPELTNRRALGINAINAVCTNAPAKPTGVYSVQQQQQEAQEHAPSNKPPPRRPTPATTASLSTQRLNGWPLPTNHVPLPPNEVIEEEEYSDLSISDNEVPMQMSAAAQAAALSAFLSLSNSDSDETESQTKITGIYREPLDLDGLENMVLGILRTGRLTIQGTPGDMTKIQPALFALQANEKEIPQLLPQLMQSPLFNPTERVPTPKMTPNNSGSSLPVCAQELLQNGHIRIVMPIDTAIYTLLKSHCAKTAKQAEATITTLMSNNYIPVDSFSKMPPLLFQSSLSRPQTPQYKSSEKLSHTDKDLSGSSISSISTTASADYSGTSTTTSSGSLIDPPSVAENDNEESRDTFEEDDGSKKTSFKAERKRRTSKVLRRPLRHRSSSSELSDEESMKSLNERRLIPDQSTWNTSIIDNNTLVCQYGDAPHPLLMWNPKLILDFQVKSSLGLLCGTVIGVDPSKPIVTIRVVNTTSKNVAFSIRSFRQSTIFTPQVVYPAKGLHFLERDQSWEDNVELYPQVKGETEIFVIDLLVCKLDEQPSWNVLRKYAAMRRLKNELKTSLNARRPSKKRASVFSMPGSKEQKEENMKVILSHGLQCVVKGKLEEAEIIFTQALLLPDFQRIELKAFVYICLAVVANKRQNKGHYDSLLPVLNEVSAASQLVDAVEATPGTVRMPRMMQLVKQLRKELDVHKIFIEFRQKTDGKKLPRMEDSQWKESENITLAGGTLSCNATTVHIPENAVKEPTQITVSTPEVAQLDRMLRNAGWDNTVKIIAAVHIDCSPITGRFRLPLKVTAVLSKKLSSFSQCLRLVHSNYLRHWEDVTDDPYSFVEVEGDRVVMETDHSGWLAVTSVQFDPSSIILKAMRSLSVEPITLHFSVYGLTIPETQILQVAIFVSPGVATEEKPEHHVPIAFPYTVQAYPGERLRLTFQGQLEPELSENEHDLNYEFSVQHTHTSICEKWLRMTSPPDAPLSGKLVVSSCRNSSGDWEPISEIRLSSKTGFASPKTSKKTAATSSSSEN